MVEGSTTVCSTRQIVGTAKTFHENLTPSSRRSTEIDRSTNFQMGTVLELLDGILACNSGNMNVCGGGKCINITNTISYVIVNIINIDVSPLPTSTQIKLGIDSMQFESAEGSISSFFGAAIEDVAFVAGESAHCKGVQGAGDENDT